MADAHSIEIEPEIKRGVLGPLMALSALGLVVYLYWPVLSSIARICWTDDDYSHGLLLPFVTIYLLWDRRQKIEDSFARATASFSLVGTGLLVLGVFLFLVGQTANSLFASWLSFFPTILGTICLVFGTQGARVFILPLLLNFMAKPLPDSLVPKLFNPFQTYAAKISAQVLSSLDVPVHLIGNIIEIPGMRLLVEEACSGMRSIMALLTVALIVVYLFERPLIGQAVIVLMSIVVAMTLNVFRVALTGILAHFYDPRSATGFFHGFSGMVVFFAGLVILYSIGLLLNRFSWARYEEAAALP